MQQVRSNGKLSLDLSSSKALPPSTLLPVSSIVSSLYTSDWKNFASKRWGECWMKFLKMEDAKNDGSYESVRGIVKSIFKDYE